MESALNITLIRDLIAVDFLPTLYNAGIISERCCCMYGNQISLFSPTTNQNLFVTECAM